MLNCQRVSKAMKNEKFFVISQQKTLKRKIREEAFTKAVLIDDCGCLKKRYLFCPSLALTLRLIIKVRIGVTKKLKRDEIMGKV
jgi:hypothetical protein